MVNKRPYDAYFPDLMRRNDIMAPFLGEGLAHGWCSVACAAGSISSWRAGGVYGTISG